MCKTKKSSIKTFSSLLIRIRVKVVRLARNFWCENRLLCTLTDLRCIRSRYMSSFKFGYFFNLVVFYTYCYSRTETIHTREFHSESSRKKLRKKESQFRLICVKELKKKIQSDSLLHSEELLICQKK